MNLATASTAYLRAPAARVARSRRPRLPRRIRVLLHRCRLDHELAAGCLPSASEDHALRARQLVQPASRRRVARSLRRLVAEATSPARARFGSAIPADRAAVRRWRDALLGAADRLEQPTPVNPAAVAGLLALLRDGNGPLYSETAEVSPLARTLAACLGAPALERADLPELVEVVRLVDPAARVGLAELN